MHIKTLYRVMDPELTSDCSLPACCLIYCHHIIFNSLITKANFGPVWLIYRFIYSPLARYSKMKFVMSC